MIADQNYRKRFPEVKLPDNPDFLVNAQYHVLAYMGEDWGRGKPRFSKEMVVGYTKFINLLGGVISWDVPIDKYDGHLLQPFEDQLAAITTAI